MLAPSASPQRGQVRKEPQVLSEFLVSAALQWVSLPYLPQRQRARISRSTVSQPPELEWGRMLSEGRQYLRDQWWISIFPGLTIMITARAVITMGDGLRDAISPRLKV